MASHQTFSGQLWHLTDQTKFDQTNLLYIINGEVYKFTIGKQMSGQFSTLIISTGINLIFITLTFTMSKLSFIKLYMLTFIMSKHIKMLLVIQDSKG